MSATAAATATAKPQTPASVDVKAEQLGFYGHLESPPWDHKTGPLVPDCHPIYAKQKSHSGWIHGRPGDIVVVRSINSHGPDDAKSHRLVSREWQIDVMSGVFRHGLPWKVGGFIGRTFRDEDHENIVVAEREWLTNAVLPFVDRSSANPSGPLWFVFEETEPAYGGGGAFNTRYNMLYDDDSAGKTWFFESKRPVFAEVLEAGSTYVERPSEFAPLSNVFVRVGSAVDAEVQQNPATTAAEAVTKPLAAWTPMTRPPSYKGLVRAWTIGFDEIREGSELSHWGGTASVLCCLESEIDAKVTSEIIARKGNAKVHSIRPLGRYIIVVYHETPELKAARLARDAARRVEYMTAAPMYTTPT